MSSEFDSDHNKKPESILPQSTSEPMSVDPAEPQPSPTPRRSFLKILGLGALGGASPVLNSRAWAGTWKKIGTTSSGGGLKWRKLAPTTINQIGFANIAAGSYHTIALRSDGLVFCSGYNLQGQLGDNTTTTRSTFVQRAN